MEDDEVVFTLRAPGAERVFLVGDFNNWNPTLERMDKEGDVFTIRLYLLPGSHRYKFVVDGEWRVDPENRPRDPTKGSGFVLEERAGMIVMATDTPLPDEDEPQLEPSLRYAGAGFLDLGDTSSDQAVDLYVDYESKHIDAEVDLQTTNDTWEWSPLKASVLFNGGFVRVKFENGFFQAFENDTMWTSNDPFRVVGDVGIYKYNAGYDRKGFSLVSPEFLKTRLRAMYTDFFEQRLFTPVTIPVSDFNGFPASATPDTTVYGFTPSFDDEDTWALDIFSDMGSVKAGYVHRQNRGMNPGILADVERLPGQFLVTSFNTREYWSGNSLWVDWKAIDGVTIGGGFGWSDAVIRQTAVTVTADSSLGDVGIGQDTGSADGETPFQTSDLWSAKIGYVRDALQCTATVRWNDFDFQSGIQPESKARINTVDLDASYRAERWSVRGLVRYIDQDYGETPVEFQYFTPTRNYWLDWGDGLDVPGQVAFDMPTASQVSIVLGWNDRDYDLANPLRPVNPFALLLTIDEVSSHLFDGLQYVAARLDGEYGITDRIYFDVHARVARYDKASWLLEKTFYDYYLESGYRNDRLSLSLSVGPDPVVLDPVPNDFRNNGWEQALRQGIPASLTRDQAAELGVGLGNSEQTLKDNQALKLELIVFF